MKPDETVTSKKTSSKTEYYKENIKNQTQTKDTILTVSDFKVLKIHKVKFQNVFHY